ncbi:uncharacterized protein LOC129777510 isoform X8 [Toxorhynchites rutilus septentrionalis]|uniref:uncharacterized protein LOC129777510 isoform X8 n=1 Tax=Toxorhynchites rutilus septentrionalis TaxID=329112 RepID=UPI00247AD3FF|nr:uncharacterized protein LOC129777510 isoform X8 [Toxorhynchites rutilus septentrionalis]
MAATMRSRGLHHASSLGNIEASSSQSNTNLAARSYDSEDENMGRKKGRPFDTGSGLRAPVYSKGDIREQYCLTDRQLSSIEQPRRERFFGCWSGRNAPQSFLGVCVGRRAPSDENLADYAPMQRYPRYIHPGPISKSILQQYDDELDNPYFRRKPTSFLAGSGGSSGGGGIGGPMVTGSSATLPSGETRRCTWMPMDDEAVRMEGPSYSLCPLAISVPTFLSSRPRVNCQPQRCPAASDELEHSSWNRASSPFVIGTPVACSSGKAAAYLSRSTDQLTGMYRCPAHTDLPPPPPPPNVSLIDGVAGGPPRTKHVSFARSYTLTSFDEAMGGRPLSRLAAARSQERLIGGKKPTITLSQQQATTQFGTPLHSILQQPSHQPLLAQQLQQHQQQQQQQQLGGQPQPPSVHQHIHTHQHLQHIQQSHPGQLIAQHHHQHQHHHVLPQQQQQQQLQQQHQPQQKQQQQQLQAAPCSNAALAAPPPTVAAPTGSQQEVFVVEKIKRSAMKTQATQTEVYLNKKAPAPHQLSLSPRTIHRVKMVSQGAQTNGGLNGRKLTKSLSEAGDRIQENGIDSGAALDEPKTNSLNRRMSAHVSMHQDKQLQQRRASYAYVAPETHSLTRKNSITHQQIQKVQPMIQTPSYQQQKQPMSQSHQQPQPLSQQISAQQQQFQPLIKPQSPILSQPSHPPPSCPITPPNIQPLDMQDDTKSSSDESCSTCDSESDREDEKEIFIDFKPRVSPIPSPNAVKKKKLLKTLSDGEILLDRKKSKTPDAPTTISASEEDLKSPALENIQKDPPTNLQFSETPIKDEGIFFGSPLTEADRRKESFRKRSVSLDNPTSMEEEEKGLLEELKADAKDDKLTSPPSPSKEEKLSIKSHSPFHSSESLATRDNSDGIWNESQATIMTTSLTDNGKLTPSSRRKNLLLQHQQRSSMDTDALDIEDIADQPLPPLPVNVVPATMQSICTTTPTTPGSQSFPLPVTCMTIPIASSPSTATGVATAPTTTTTTTTTATPTITTGIVKPTPSIAVIPSPSIEREERDLQQRPMQKSATLRRLSRPPSPSKRRASDQRKLSKIEPLIHRSPDTNERNVPTLKDQSPISAPTVPPLPVTPAMPPPKLSSSTPTHPLPALSSTVNSGSGSRIPPAVPSARFEHAKLKGFEEKDLFGDGGAGSEGSTTEDYATCTDNSKRTGSTPPVGAKGIFKTTLAIRPTTKQVTANAVQEGSSFESASSLYSLARVDAICEDTPPVEENTATPQIPPLPKPSPAHSLSSSSSGSYNMATKTRRSSPSRTVVPKPLPAKVKIKPESISDDERSEKRYSSSHDEKDIRGTLTRPARKGRDWNEEERRRKKSAFKLEFDKDSLKTYTTPMLRQPSPGFKKLSPEDKSALNVLDGASPSSKQKRFRPKTRKSPRTRTATSDDVTSTPMRRSKTPLIKSPEKPAIHTPTPIPKLSPVQYYSQIKSPPNQESPKKQKISPEQRLKAISTESLRSVSPGSDSVFYSEADALSQCEQQVHCHHCGKEVEAISIPGELEGSLATLSLDSTDADRPDIVQPPEGFADSPQCTKTTHRLYKKMDKRFRSEDRHADRRHFKSRQEYRAKSEERGKDDSEQSNLRSAGSSPCVAPVAPYGEHQAEPEQGIYRGNYRAGTWICIADRDAFRRYDLSSDGSFERPTRTVAERRGSTDSEKDFYKRYQAISHRLVHRRSCVELYRRQNTTNFEPDKIVVVSRKSGEFGFRIHGSRPVVVSAIEPDTPAETSGLEVGDIVLSVNGISVIDKSHSEVVKVAHAGSDTLELKIVRTIGVHSPLEDNTPVVAIYAGFLWRHSNSSSKKWVRRWFSLRPDHCLYYFKSELDIHPIGVVILTNHKVERLSAEVGGRPFSFTIDTGENTKVQLAGDNDEAASRWIAVISHAAQQGDPWLDNSARNLRIPASCVPKPDCVGPLTKLGSKWRSWTKRYCVLKDAVLYFYHEASSKSAFGMACLQGYRIQPSSAGGKKYAFEIVPPELTLRHYYFHTDTEMDKRRWVTALEYSIDRWMKAG